VKKTNENDDDDEEEERKGNVSKGDGRTLNKLPLLQIKAIHTRSGWC